MRLTVNLDPELYVLAKSLAREEDCSISAAVNRLLRRALTQGVQQGPKQSGRLKKRSGFVISPGRKPVTADVVRRIEAADDET